MWERLGDPDNYIEPFCGSAAVLLARPTPPKVETLNDYDCMVSNFWRATSKDPEAVAEHADHPVHECDLHARHRHLVLSGEAARFRERMRTDPDYYDARFAGWWCWGACCWIGSGWCVSPESAECDQIPRLSDQVGVGVTPLKHSRPSLNGTVGGAVSNAVVHSAPDRRLHQKRAALGNRRGVTKAADPGESHRPQLADAFARGRGVHGHDAAETCRERREWLVAWFAQLRDRLRAVRVCCGDWLRVCDSDSVTTRLGTVGIFFDPPYSAEAGRDNQLYGHESGTVAHDVRAYCLARGGDPRMRICLAGYEGEGHEELLQHGWEVVAWKTAGGYGNQSGKVNANSLRERLYFSPHCLDPDVERLPLFAGQIREED